jgi:hypothetical protein
MLSAPLIHGAYQGEPSFEPGALLVMDFVRRRYRRGPGRGRVASDPAGISGWQSVGHAGFGRTRVNGAYPPFAPDAPLIGDGGLLVPEARTNSIRNPVMAGAVVGSPGTFPTYWGGAVLSSGLNRQIVGIGVENGLPFLDVRIFGSLPAAGDALVLFDNASSIAAENGQTWTSHGHISLVAGTLVAGVFHRQEYRDSGGNFLLSTNVGASFLLDATLREYRRSRTIATANTAFIRSGLYIFFSAAGDVDFTVRIAVPNLKLGRDINDPPILQTTGLPATRTLVNPSVQITPPPAFEVRSRFRIIAEPGAGTFRRVFSVNNGSTSNAADVYINGTRNIRLFARSGGTTVVDGGPASQLEVGRYYDLVARYQTDAFSMSLDGVPIFSDTSGAMPVGLDRIQFGNGVELLDARALNGEIANLSLREAA